MGFPKPTLTDNGKQLQLKAIAGKELKFSSIKIGSGKVPTATDLTKMTSLVGLIHSFDIVSAKKLNDTVELITTFDNLEVGTGFEFREIGVFAFDPDTSEEVLYCYTNCGNQCEVVEPTSTDFVEKTLKVPVSVGNAKNISIVINSDLNYITRTEEESLRHSDDEGILSVLLYGSQDDIRFGDGYLIIGSSKTETVTKEYANDEEIITAFIPNGITSVGSSTFYKCSNLRRVFFPSTLQKIGSSAFFACLSLDDIIIPNGVEIESNVFSGCINLKTVKLPNDLLELKLNAFVDCRSLVNIELPESLQSIGDYAFQLCKSLKTIDIPSSVTEIGKSAFWNCYALKSFVIKKTDGVVTLSNSNAFERTPIADGEGYIYVPDALVDSYKAATNWDAFTNQIRPISELKVAE